MCVCVYPTPPPCAGYDTRSILFFFKQTEFALLYTHSLRSLTWSKTLTDLPRTWTQIADSISYNNNRYAKRAFNIHIQSVTCKLSQLSTVCEESSTMTIHSFRNLQAASYAVCYSLRSTKQRFLSVSLRTELKFRKELKMYNGDYEGTATQMPHSDRPKKKRIELVAKVQTMIDNDPSKSTRSIAIARDIALSEFLFRNEEHTR